MQRNLPNPTVFFRDPNYNEKAKLSENEINAIFNRPNIEPPNLLPNQNNQNNQNSNQNNQNPKFDEINNAKVFQIQSLHNDLVLLKTTFQAKITDIEKRLSIIEHPPNLNQNQANMQPFSPPQQLTHFQPLQTQMQQGFQPPQQNFQPPQQNFQPPQQNFQPPQQSFQPPQQSFQPPQQSFQPPQQSFQPPQQSFQQPQQGGFQQPQQGGFQPFRAANLPNFRS